MPPASYCVSKPGIRPYSLPSFQLLTTAPQPTTMCNTLICSPQPCATMCNHVPPCAVQPAQLPASDNSSSAYNHVQPCATQSCAPHNHVQPRATMCNAPMCYPCAQPCATMCTHVQCTHVLPMCTLCKAPMCHDTTTHELLHVKPTSKKQYNNPPNTCTCACPTKPTKT